MSYMRFCRSSDGGLFFDYEQCIYIHCCLSSRRHDHTKHVVSVEAVCHLERMRLTTHDRKMRRGVCRGLCLQAREYPLAGFLEDAFRSGIEEFVHARGEANCLVKMSFSFSFSNFCLQVLIEVFFKKKTGRVENKGRKVYIIL